MEQVKLLGEYLRDQTRLTDRQVVDGLRQQFIARDRGERKRLGEILIDCGYVTRRDVDAAVARQRSEQLRGSGLRPAF